MEVLQELAAIGKDICAIATCAALLVRPVREWLFGFEAIREGQRCLLRSEIVRLYSGTGTSGSCGNTNTRTCPSPIRHTRP